MKKNKTSRAWVHDHVNDPWVQRAQAEGYRARAAFKLLEIDDRDSLLRPGAVVVDLGAAPGSWCQVAVRRCGPKARIFALDLLPMEPVAGVDFLLGDFSEDQARSVHLCELAVEFAVRHLKPGGQFVVKVFQGEGFMEFRKQMEVAFASVQVRKPKASRDRSAEVYLLGKGPRRP